MEEGGGRREEGGGKMEEGGGRRQEGGGKRQEGGGKMEEKRAKIIKSVRDLEVYKFAFKTAMEIFELSKSFPIEEKYSLIDQIRRSSRSVCTCLSEAWRKRRYKAYFVNKLSDASQEAAETQTWLEFALACKYMEGEKYEELDRMYERIFAMLITMGQKADSFCRV